MAMAKPPSLGRIDGGKAAEGQSMYSTTAEEEQLPDQAKEDAKKKEESIPPVPFRKLFRCDLLRFDK